MLKGELIPHRDPVRFTDPVRRLLHGLAARNTPKAIVSTQLGAADNLLDDSVVGPQQNPEENSLDWPSLDEVYEEVKNSVAAQNDRLKSIDTKANFGLAAATLLTAGVTGLGRALAESVQDVNTHKSILGFDVSVNRVVDGITIASLVVYAFVAFSAFMAYRLRTFREAPDPSRLVEKYIHEDPRLTKATITNRRAKDYVINEKVIGRKAWWTSATMISLIAEAALLVLIAVVQVKWL